MLLLLDDEERSFFEEDLLPVLFAFTEVLGFFRLLAIPSVGRLSERLSAARRSDILVRMGLISIKTWPHYYVKMTPDIWSANEGERLFLGAEAYEVFSSIPLTKGQMLTRYSSTFHSRQR